MDTLVILEEGNLPHPRFSQFNTLVPWCTLNGIHPATAQYAMGEELKRWRLAEVELRDIKERAFEEYGEPLDNMTAFNYLGRVMTAVDDDWPELVCNLCNASKSLGVVVVDIEPGGVGYEGVGKFF